jgi:hypothetical protein
MRRAYIFVTISFENVPSRKAEFEREKSKQSLLCSVHRLNGVAGVFGLPRRTKKEFRRLHFVQFFL